MATKLRVVSSAYRLFFDGASKGNPGPAAGGWCLQKEDGTMVAYGWRFIGTHRTNNEAEYNGLIEGLKFARDYFVLPRVVYVHGDSQLVIEQMKGRWRCNSLKLKPLHEEARTLVANLNVELVFEYIPRGENKDADRYANLGVRDRGVVAKECATQT